MLYALRKVVDCRGVVLGVVCMKGDGSRIFISKAELKDVVFSNIKVSSDYKILGNLKEEKVDSVNLYHGSKGGIVGKISCFASRAECDFGRGFYLGESIQQARGVCSEGRSPVVYSMSVILNGLRIYRFDDLVRWALFVGCNRKFIDYSGYKRLSYFVSEVSSYDVIYGLIADDRISTVFPQFMSGEITDICLIECLKLVKYGNQYVLKTEKACKRVIVSQCKPLKGYELQMTSAERAREIQNMGMRVEELKRRYRREGKYIDEILKEWR